MATVSFCRIKSERRVSAKRIPVASSGVRIHSILWGVVSTSPKDSGSRFVGSGELEAHNVGAAELILFANLRIVSV